MSEISMAKDLVARVLADHQPDRATEICTCGEETSLIAELSAPKWAVTVRRERDFAQHQADMLARAQAGEDW